MRWILIISGLVALANGKSVTNEKAAAINRVITQTLTVSDGGEFGDWHQAEICPADTFVSGFELRVEENQYTGDDTAANAVRLFCKSKRNVQRGAVYSFDGLWGDWTGRRDCVDEITDTYFMTAFSLRVEESQGFSDDTSLNNIRMRCSQPEAIYENSYYLPGDGGPWGDWGEWSDECRSGSAICGLAVKFEGVQGNVGDDTALNDVKMFCCDM